MDTTKDSLSDRAQRLQQRNTVKDRSASVSDEMEIDRKYPYPSGTSSDMPMPTTWKPPTPRSFPDSFAPPAFSGTNADPDTWLAHFQRYVEYRQLPDDDAMAIFPLFLKDSAIDWYENLARNVKAEWKSMTDNFKAYFRKSPLDYVFEEEPSLLALNAHMRKREIISRRCISSQNGSLLWTTICCCG